MKQHNAIQLFEDKKVRTIWDSEQEKWFISIIDVIGVLTSSPRPRKYWNALKTKLIAEGSELSHKLGQLKMRSADGKLYQFAYLTDIITKAWSGKTTREYKILKGLKKENLRDNMTNTELILNMLAEASTKDISLAVEPESLEESAKVAQQGGHVANVARKELESKT